MISMTGHKGVFNPRVRLILMPPALRLIRKVQAFPHTLAKKVLPNHAGWSKQHPMYLAFMCNRDGQISSTYPIPEAL
jgi:hypothetical protein